MLNDPNWYPLTVGLSQWNAQAATAGGQAVYNLVITGSLLTIIPIMAAFLLPAALLAVGPGRRQRQAVTGSRPIQPHPFRLRSTVLFDLESAPGNRNSKKGAMMPRAPRSRIAAAAGAAAGLALRRRARGVLQLQLQSSGSGRRERTPAARPPRPAPVAIAAALQQPTTLTWWAWAPQDKAHRRRVREEVPEGQGQPGQRRHRHHRVHQAAERDQGRLGRPGRRAGRVLRAAAVRARRVAGRPDATASAASRASSAPPCGTRSTSTASWSGCRRTPGRWRCSTTRRSSTSTA